MLVKEKSQCCGCTACKAVCPHDAIVMRQDVLGFPYPEIMEDRCTGCGLCEKVCDFVKAHKPAPSSEEVSVSVYAARNKDNAALAESQSGGVFTALSDLILSGSGAIYGAAMNDDFTVRHIRAVTAAERDRLRGSKYVQSDMGEVFRQVRKDLSEGRKVLFTGTPCQNAGLASYIPERLKEGLVLVDFICHGVPSPAVWADYLAYMGRKGSVEKVCFRDKASGGWKVHNETFRYSSGKTLTRETYKVLFYKNIMLRHSCAVCPYHLGERKADITMADFWGVGEVVPEMDGNAGTSMVICHTEKGKALLDEARVNLNMLQVNLSGDFISRKNPNLLRPSRIYKDRETFEKEYAEKGFRHVARKWGDMGWRYKAWQLKVLIRRLTGRR